jgi:hypothetical protein
MGLVPGELGLEVLEALVDERITPSASVKDKIKKKWWRFKTKVKDLFN